MTSWLCSIPLAAQLFAQCGPAEPLAVGYVEGEYTLLAPISTARLLEVPVRRGERLKAGAIVAEQERRDAEIAVAEAEAAASKAKAQLENLRQGKRPEEIAVIEAALTSAAAKLNEARRNLQRQQDLARRGFSSQSDLEAAGTTVETAQASVAELTANLAVARLPARDEEIVAASSAAEQAVASLEAARWRLEQRSIAAPADGQVNDVLLRQGEVSGPSAPVVSFLPDGATKLKLYVAEPSLAGLRQGARLQVRCDGCGDNQFAIISYIADEPEFTPPVIYSLNRRQKLVYLVEARPEAEAARLKPGQIVDVVLAGDGS